MPDDEAPQGEDQSEGRQDPPDTGGEADFGDDLEKWKVHSKKHEGLWRNHEKLWRGAGMEPTAENLKSLIDSQKRLKAAEDADKSEIQRANEAKAVSDKAAADAQAKLMRLTVAMRKGLTEAQAKRLVGASEEELEADAEELLASFGQKNNAGDDGAGKPTRPKERLRSGAVPDEEPDETDPHKLAASVPRF